MNTLKTKLTALILGLSLILAGTVSAQGFGKGQGQGMRAAGGPGQFQRGPMMTEEMRTEMYQARYDVLAKLADKSVSDVKEDSTRQPFFTLLKKYDVNEVNFREAMHSKAKTVVQKAIKSGKVSKEDGEAMLKRMELREKMGFQKGPGRKGSQGQGRRGGNGARCIR